jgi:hypothetical protein
MGWGVAQVVEYLPSKHEALSLNPTTASKNKHIQLSYYKNK